MISDVDRHWEGPDTGQKAMETEAPRREARRTGAAPLGERLQPPKCRWGLGRSGGQRARWKLSQTELRYQHRDPGFSVNPGQDQQMENQHLYIIVVKSLRTHTQSDRKLKEA